MIANTTMSVGKLLTGEQAAEVLGIREQTLAVWRSTRRYNLPYIRVGGAVRYRAADLERWLESQTVSGVEAAN